MTAKTHKGLEEAKDGKLRIKIADEKSLASARELLVAAAELRAAATVNGRTSTTWPSSPRPDLPLALKAVERTGAFAVLRESRP